MCKDCFNGCLDIVSDQCVKYTGPSNEELGINYGDSLSQVETAIFQYLHTIQENTFMFNPGEVCDEINSFIPDEYSSVTEFVAGLIYAMCALSSHVSEISQIVNNQARPYTLGCLPTDTPNNTHDILQLVLNGMCANRAEITAIKLDLATNYVRIDELDDYIADYLARNPIVIPTTSTTTTIPPTTSSTSSTTTSSTTNQAIDCALSAWAAWSDCTAGSRFRTRTVLTPASNGGIPCGVLIENEACTGPEYKTGSIVVTGDTRINIILELTGLSIFPGYTLQPASSSAIFYSNIVSGNEPLIIDMTEYATLGKLILKRTAVTSAPNYLPVNFVSMSLVFKKPSFPDKVMSYNGNFINLENGYGAKSIVYTTVTQ